MATVQHEIVVGVQPNQVWDAVRDVGAIHTRLAPGFVVDVKLEEGARVVTFGTGATARELIVDCDDDSRRLAWAVVESPLNMSHYNASMQVFAEGSNSESCRVVWTADLLPHDVAPRVSEIIATGLAVMKQTMEGA
jgi:hypothetical protein